MADNVPTAVLTQVASDWQRQFPTLKRHKGGQKLLKRVGGVVLGVELGKFYSSAYRPRFVLYNLLDPTATGLIPSVYQSLVNQKGLQVTIEYKHHPRDHLQACEWMREQARVDLDKIPTLEDVIRGILRYIDLDLRGVNPGYSCKTVMLLSRLVPEEQQSEEFFQAARERLFRFPTQYLEMETGGIEPWIELLRSTQPEQLARAASENLARFKLESVPLVGDLIA